MMKYFGISLNTYFDLGESILVGPKRGYETLFTGTSPRLRDPQGTEANGYAGQRVFGFGQI